MHPGSATGRRAPPWLGPAAALVLTTLIFASALHGMTGGQEVADDAPHLLELAREPLVLWGDSSAGVGERWGSFPPLLPLVFGSLVAPWTTVVSDFWAIRLGVLCWSLVVLALLHRRLVRTGIPLEKRRAVLWLFAVLPSVWGAAALNPQEEIYVSVFALLLFEVATTGRSSWIAPLLVLSTLAGKYFLLILILPLAFASTAPLRNLLLYGGSGFGALMAYMGYHRLVHGVAPITSYVLEPSAAVSVWGLLWHLGLRLPPSVAQLGSVLLCGVAVLAFVVAARSRSVPLPFSMSISLLITIMALSIATPAYVLWSVPLILICLPAIESRRPRVQIGLLLATWGVGEWGANFARGVERNLIGSSGGKAAFVDRVGSLLGRDFPFDTLHLGCVSVVVLSGLLLIAVLWRAGRSGPWGGSVRVQRA